MIKLTPIEAKLIEETLEQVAELIGSGELYLLDDVEGDIKESLEIIKACNSYAEGMHITEEELEPDE